MHHNPCDNCGGEAFAQAIGSAFLKVAQDVPYSRGVVGAGQGEVGEKVHLFLGGRLSPNTLDLASSTMMIWLNGEWKNEEQASVSVSDGAYLRGEGCFETMLACRGRVFELGRHWLRFERACQRLGIELLDCEAARSVAEELLERNAFEPDQRVRLRVTRSPQSLLFTAKVAPPAPKQLILHRTQYCRNEQSALAGMKVISYGENALALAEAKRKGADEILFGNTRGEWCEGAWSNVFAVEGGTLLTPPLSSGCLPGVTREVVMSLAEKAGLEPEEEVRSIAQLQGVDELFLTSSVLGVGAVAEFDGRPLQEGPVTKLLAGLLREREMGG